MACLEEVAVVVGHPNGGEVVGDQSVAMLMPQKRAPPKSIVREKA